MSRSPRIPGMKDILAAGKKPMDVNGRSAGSHDERRRGRLLSRLPRPAERKPATWLDASADGAIEAFAAALKAAL